MKVSVGFSPLLILANHEASNNWNNSTIMSLFCVRAHGTSQDYFSYFLWCFQAFWWMLGFFENKML